MIEPAKKRAPRKAAAKSVAPEPITNAPDVDPTPVAGEPAVMTRDEADKVWPPTVHELWLRVMNQVRSIEKGDYNADQKFRFRGIEAVLDAIGPALRDVGVLVIPHRIVEHNSEEYTTKHGTRMVNRTVKVQWRVYGPQGDWFDGESAGEAADAGDKSLTKAQSVAQRVFLLQALNIPTGEPDPDSSSHERAFEPDGPVERARREWAEKHGQAQPPQTAANEPQREAQPQQPTPQAQAGEENQAAEADNEAARKEMWRVAKGLGWKWKPLADRFKSDYGVETHRADAAILESFTMIIVSEAEAEEERAKAVVADQLGGKEIPPDEGPWPESTPGSERLL